MHLVENDKSVEMILKIEFWIGKLCSVLLGFKVEIQGVKRAANLKSKRCFARLTRPQ